MKRLAALALTLAVLAPVAPAEAQPGSPWAHAPCSGLAHAWRVYMGLPPVFDRIAMRESRCNPGAVSPGGDRGLYQIAPVTRRWCARQLPGFQVHHMGWNTLCARILFDLYGYRPWWAPGWRP